MTLSSIVLKQMNSKYFIDTNVILYLFSREIKKAERAEELLAQGGIVSVQVLNEFISVASRKLRLTWEEIEETHSAITSSCLVEPLTQITTERAMRIAKRYQMSFYDALIVAAALLANTSILYTEDLQHGQSIERQLTVCNPFRNEV